MKNILEKKDRKWLTYLIYKKVIENKLESLVHKQKNEASQTRKDIQGKYSSTQQNKSSTEHEDRASREKGRKQ